MWITKWLQRREEQPLALEPRRATIPKATPVPEPPPPPRPARAVRRAGRPMATSLTRTIDELEMNPGVTPAELAESLDVTQSYARTLLRRARERSGKPTLETPIGAPSPAPVLRPPVASRRTVTLNLAEAGHSAEYIADKLQTTVGEVEFILKVHRLVCA